MAEKQAAKNNTFCWVELATRNPEAAQAFYGPTLGWEFKEKAVSGQAPYIVAKKGEDAVAGILRGDSPHWVGNIAVENVDAIAKKAETLGAKIVEAPADWGEGGRSAVLRDPLGAEICLWKAKEPHSAERNSVGSFCWMELMTKDIAKAEKFYTELFGWQAKREPSMPNYTMFSLGDTMVAGMMQIMKEMAGANPQWLVYFSVSDCDETAKTANKSKAQIQVPPQDIPKVGRFSVITDPNGATFGVIKLLTQASTKPAERLSA
ncbi:MAG: VOC family protein [Bdellovibrionota bacterium]